MRCPSCGGSSPAGARYCPTCGRALQGGRGDERRLVTVLFADLVGYTALAETRDPESVKNLVDRLFERLAADVVAHGGRVDKIVGDAIMALFGAPQAHEDDAERAVRTGLAMQRTLEAHAEELGVVLRMRVGIDSGEVLVGSLRAGGDYTAMGDVVNTASRLQTAAEPGQVLVGAQTRAATRGVIRYRSAGDIQAKGRDEPVRAWIAQEALLPPGHRPQRARTPLIGRDAEVGLLRHALAVAFERRRAQFALLLGDAGIGKTRLAEELAKIARSERDAPVLEGRCVPYGESSVWWPLAEALRQACGIGPTDDKETAAAKGRSAVGNLFGLAPDDRELHRVLNGLAYLLDHNTLGELEPARARDEALRSMQRCLERLTASRPLVFVLSELHWADDLLLEFLDRLLGRIGHLPILVIATARPEILDRWQPPAGRHNQVVVHLDPLDAVSTAELLAELGVEPPSAEVREALVERSGGNPLFLEELVALAASDRPIDELPLTLRGLVAARLDALEAGERSVLEDAAVAGRSGDAEVLTAMAGPDRAPVVAAALADLSNVDLLALGTDGSQWEFRSELVREVAYGTLTKAARARRHAILAAWLESRAGEQPTSEELDELAHHFGTAAALVLELGQVPDVGADVVTRALSWVQRAAERAEADELWLPAAALLDQALNLVGAAGPPAQRVQLCLSRARARLGMRDTAGAAADLAQVFAWARDQGERSVEVRALILRGELEQLEGRIAESLATLETAVASARELGDRQAMADALQKTGRTRLVAGDDVGADRASVEALEAYRDLGDRRGEAWALQSLAWTAFMRGDLEPAEELLSASAAAFSEIGDFGGRGWAVGLAAWVRFTQGYLDEAETIAYSVIDEAAGIGDRWAYAMMQVLLANIALWKGRTAEAVSLAGEARATFAGLREPFGELQALGPLSRGVLALGDIDQARVLFDETLEVAGRQLDPKMAGFARVGILNALTQQLGEGPDMLGPPFSPLSPADHPDLGEATAVYGLALLQAGRVAEALDELTQVGEHEDGSEGPTHLPPAAWLNVAWGFLAAGHADRAQEALRRAEAAGAEPTYCDRMWAALIGAFLALAEGHPKAMDAALDEARAIADATEDRLSQAVVRVARAMVLAAVESPRAAGAMAEADGRLDELGVDLAGWKQVFRLVATAAQRLAVPEGAMSPAD